MSGKAFKTPPSLNELLAVFNDVGGDISTNNIQSAYSECDPCRVNMAIHTLLRRGLLIRKQKGAGLRPGIYNITSLGRIEATRLNHGGAA